MNGKLVGTGLGLTALIGGIAAYALNVYAFYKELPPDEVAITLTPSGSDVSTPITISDLQAIDATSSPLRFRACFTASLRPEARAGYTRYPEAEPLTGPGWFDCYDAQAIGAALSAGEATAYLSARDIREGVDRVVALFPDGRGYAWHQLNETFDK